MVEFFGRRFAACADPNGRDIRIVGSSTGAMLSGPRGEPPQEQLLLANRCTQVHPVYHASQRPAAGSYRPQEPPQVAQVGDDGELLVLFVLTIVLVTKECPAQAAGGHPRARASVTVSLLPFRYDSGVGIDRALIGRFHETGTCTTNGLPR
jgi:hypothetical protein